MTGIDIIVIEIAGKFLGAKPINQYWKNICEGKETINFLGVCNKLGLLPKTTEWHPLWLNF